MGSGVGNGEMTCGHWLRRYNRERGLRQQAVGVLRRLADELPEVFVAAASRPLEQREVDEVVEEMLRYGRFLVEERSLRQATPVLAGEPVAPCRCGRDEVTLAACAAIP